MSTRPLVSVIMPACNTSPYIATAIASARSQSVRDIELLVVDDGSTDRTFVSALHAGAGDPRVKVMTQANAGPSAARNRAMKFAKGQFFALLDSDDEWMPGFLEAQLAVFAHRPSCGVVTANAFNRGGSLDGTPYRIARQPERTLAFLDLLREEDAVCIMSVFRRSVYDTVGPFNETLRGNEDYEFWLRAARAGFELVQTPTPLAYYRRRPDSASANDRKMAAGILKVFNMMRGECRSAAELRVLDSQVLRFERSLLALDASAALRLRDFRTAADCYYRLHQHTGDRRTKALLLASRHMPRLLSYFAEARRAARRVATGMAIRREKRVA